MLQLLFLQGFHWHDLDFVTGNFARPKKLVSGVPLYVVYLVWLSLVALFYWPCRWFAAYKLTQQYWRLRYL